MASILDKKTFEECEGASEIVLEFLKLFNYKEFELMNEFAKKWNDFGVVALSPEETIFALTSEKVKTREFKKRIKEVFYNNL